MNRDIKVRAFVDEFRRGVRLYLSNENDFIAQNINFVKTEAGECIDPSAVISMPVAQELIDDLWVAGLRPSEGSGSAGMLKATQDHLSDMRTIAFNRLKIDK